jgi:hypothetical protein
MPSALRRLDGRLRDLAILAGSVPALWALGWFWRPLRTLTLGVGAATLLAIALYNRQTDGFGADLAAGDQVFLLKYFLSSQSAILWMSVLFFMSTVFYWIGFFAKAGPVIDGAAPATPAPRDNTAQKLGSHSPGPAW